MSNMSDRDRLIAMRWAAAARITVGKGDKWSLRRDQITIDTIDTELAKGWPPADNYSPFIGSIVESDNASMGL